MPLLSPTDGVNEQEPTLISDGAMQDCDGAEYRAGATGLFVARGRGLAGTLAGSTGTGLYEAGFDGSAGYIIAHAGNSLSSALIGASVTFSLIDNLPTGSSAVVGAHYANRHYLATGVANRRLELISAAVGISSFPIGMSASSFAVGVSATVGTTGSINATTGLEYWVTEYDSTRGIESLHGSTANTSVVTGVTSIIVTVTGVSANPRANKIRWYRSVDGGGFPDGGLINETAIGITQITDVDIITGSLGIPNYGLISIGGQETDRDEAPPVFSLLFGPFQDSLLAVSVAEPRVLRFTPAGYPDSWPSGYGIPLETERHDEIVAGVILPAPERAAVFTNDSVHVVYRLPRDSDSIFAAGEAADVVTKSIGCVSRRGACVFTPPGTVGHAAWVSRDGIWIGTLATSPTPITDQLDWEGRVSVLNLSSCRLFDDPFNRRMVFLYRRTADTTYSTGIWYLDYQEFSTKGIRITFADHGPLADAVTIAASDGLRRAASIDSRSGNGQVYIEANQDLDASLLLTSTGAVRFRMRSKEFLPAGARGVADLGKATWMHGAGPPVIQHSFYFNRRDDNPETKVLVDSTLRTASDVTLGRNVNSFSVEILSVGTVSYGVQWIDYEVLGAETLGGRKGA